MTENIEVVRVGMVRRRLGARERELPPPSEPALSCLYRYLGQLAVPGLLAAYARVPHDERGEAHDERDGDRDERHLSCRDGQIRDGRGGQGQADAHPQAGYPVEAGSPAVGRPRRFSLALGVDGARIGQAIWSLIRSRARESLGRVLDLLGRVLDLLDLRRHSVQRFRREAGRKDRLRGPRRP